MASTSKSFLESDEIHDLKILDRFVALLWWHNRHSGDESVEFKQLCYESNQVYPAVDRARERKKLVADVRTSTLNKGTAFKLTPQALKSFDKAYLHVLENKPLPASDILFDESAFKSTRGYIEKVIKQINLSYDYQLYDCCTVMIRR